MPEKRAQEPWVGIEAAVRRGDARELDEYLDTLSPADIARGISRLSEEDQARVLTLLEPQDAADLIEELTDAQAANLIEDLPASQAAAIVDEMESDDRVDVLGEMGEDDAEAILRAMKPEEAEDARALLTFDPDTAGGIMETEFVAYPQGRRVDDVLDELRQNAELFSAYGIQYVYVQSEKETLVGVIRLRDLVLFPGDALLTSIMIANPVYVTVDQALDEVMQVFDRYPFVGLPVVNVEGQLVGIIRRGDAEEAYSERHEKAFMRYSGIVTGEELRSMGVFSRSSRRLVWLCLNMVLSLVAASVILGYQGTIQELFALVFFMPIICNMSGCSGNQAVAVSIRELTLGLIKPQDFRRVLAQEMKVGLINGFVLGTLLGGVALLFWPTTPNLALVVGCAFGLNTILAVSLGGLIPLLLRALKVDPALAAPPMLTTVTDMCGFLLVLTFATAALAMGHL